MNKLSQKPFSEAVEMLAQLMLLKAKRESPELFSEQIENKSISLPVKIAPKLYKSTFAD
jgi:hypothetical protein